MKCPKCSKENLPGAIFCAGCGSKLSALQNISVKRESKTQIVQSPGGIIRNYDSDDVIIGRASTCDIVIDNTGVSSKHARIYVDNSKAYIEDLRSLNGTIVNGRKINSKTPIGAADVIIIGDQKLNLGHPAIMNILSRFGGDDYSYSGGTLQLKMNTKWFGKILYFIMILLLFFPWLTVRASGSSVSFTAIDFAFNKFPADLSFMKIVNPDYGPLHTMFLFIFMGVIIGVILNFLNFKISEKFNYANILSIILFVMNVGYLSLVSSIDNLFGIVSVVLQHNFAAYLFIFICFISIFEALIEYHLINKSNR
ncbi:MAG: FHA domain-containing protein [Ignavibacteria bacterium]|nr:FHA domain-containing protein [Ignavibacteria bacterium]